jgi:hypothetical protein
MSVFAPSGYRKTYVLYFFLNVFLSITIFDELAHHALGFWITKKQNFIKHVKKCGGGGDN